jgi:hypothetical protein
MQNYIENVISLHQNQIENYIKIMDAINLPPKNSISRADAVFLQAVCLEEKPKHILEVGTWVGKSTYSLAISSGADVHTCDINNKFIDIPEYSENIYINPNTPSIVLVDKFLSLGEPKFDLVFIDGHIGNSEIQALFNVCEDSFTVVSHDFFNSTTLEYCKGFRVAYKIVKYAHDNGYEYDLYTPSKDWLPAGYFVEGFGGMNSCCVMIKVKKNNG